ncbi:MAG: LacI family DNA-binding transcriptional regulator [Rhizobiaceae bacterium]|nr:LacI family DNA-binding transcriptional regulator [Rhizobiaceae bacterium]
MISSAGESKEPQKERRFVSAEDVAKLAGVSRSAVSRTFTPGASVAPLTREKVLRAAEELGYQVNDLARAVLNNHSRLVGIVATNPEVGFRAHLAFALGKALMQRGSIPILINTGQTEDELLAAQRTLIGHRAEATIILSGSTPKTFVDLAHRNGQALVVIGRSEPGMDQVRVANTDAAARVASIFVERGYRTLGMAGSHSGTPSITEREAGFIQKAEALGAKVLVARGRDSDYAGGLDAGAALLSGQERPQAVFCVNDQIAFGLMDFARDRLGLAIPQDLAVIGFDDVPEAAWLSYRLTTFRQDPNLMASHAVRLIDRRLAEPNASPFLESVLPDLVRRESF